MRICALLGAAAAVLAASAGCRCRREPSCLSCYARSVQAPLDVRGEFPSEPQPLPAVNETPDERTGSVGASPSQKSSPCRGSSPCEQHGDGAALLVQPAALLVVAAPAAELPAGPAAGGAERDQSEKKVQLSPAAEELPREPLNVPSELPGAAAPPLVLPKLDAKATPQQRQAAIEGVYPPLPSTASAQAAERVGGAPVVEGPPLDLPSLQSLALANNPAIQVAAAAVENKRGLAIQAGAYPNPEMGYEADTINTNRTAGYHGAYVSQTIITGGKLRLAQSAAEVDYCNAQLALRRARIDVATAVRTAYFSALVAREKLRVQTILAAFTEEIYKAQIGLVTAGEAAAYEPLQLRVWVLQSRAAVVQAEQESAAARRQLAAALGTPQLELGELAGRIDMPIPAIDYEGAKALMLSQHTDVAIARNNVVQAQYLLRLARVTPKPNVNTYVAVQHDDTFVPGGTTVNVQVGGPIPAFNRNRGGIVAAQAQLTQTHAGVTLAENQLVAKLADDFGRYESNRRLTQQFQSEALRDQVRTYRGVYQRYRIDAQGVQFTDVVVAQQTLSTLLTQYVNILAAQWQAVVDVARELQVDDVYQLGELVPVTPLPEIGLPE